MHNLPNNTQRQQRQEGNVSDLRIRRKVDDFRQEPEKAPVKAIEEDEWLESKTQTKTPKSFERIRKDAKA